MTRYPLDVRHLLCPMPVIRTQNRVADLTPGDVLEVVATDLGVLVDIPAWARINGHRILETHRAGREVFVVVEVGGT
jgi:tRNA 2-thiouridine synthesizing protein A